MESADILVFLLSQNFIASDPCMEEWEESKNLCEGSQKTRFRIPIILSQCPWKDLLGEDDIKALPTDGKTIESYENESEAWNEIYEGIKQVVDKLRNDFSPKQEFLKQLEQNLFASQDQVKLTDIFVFPPLTRLDAKPKKGNVVSSREISKLSQLQSDSHILLHGDDVSGKTTLAQFIVIKLIEQNCPVLFADLASVEKIATENTFQSFYKDQFNGDYNSWKQQNNKTLVLDNLTSSTRSIRFVESAQEYFERIVVTTSSDIYRSFYWDDNRLAKYQKYRIEPLTHGDQEQLIRKRLALLDDASSLSDGSVDTIEERVNLVINNRIVPRYPFYVLSIIQTFEGFVPENFSITKYGHCYHVFILAQLIKTGISKRDEEINSCFNFCQHLAFQIYRIKLEASREFSNDEFENFVTEYKNRFILGDSILNRLKNDEFGILNENKNFRIPYMYYFFLGMYLAKPSQQQAEITERLCESSHIRANQLILQFIIHHAVDNSIIDSIQLHSMCAIDAIHPAKLCPEETRRFSNVIEELPQNVLSDKSVAQERKQQRKNRDIDERHQFANEAAGDDETIELVNATYRILKNNELLGHVLKSRYGRLEKSQIKEIIETIADGGLRLVNSLLSDDEEITDLAKYIHEVYPDRTLPEIKTLLQYLSFVWTMHNIEAVVKAIRNKHIGELVSEIAREKHTPAYDVIEYFNALDNAEELTDELHNKLSKLMKKHKDPFVSGVLSVRTQMYMNVHRSKQIVEQKFCSLLNIPHRYKKRMMN